MPHLAGSRGRRAIIHIGTEKTGTTLLQHTLAANRQMLARNGILYPRSFGKINHTRLVAAAEDDGVVDNIKAHILASRRETEVELRQNLKRDAERELCGDDDWHTVVISSELIHSRLHASSEIERLCSYVADLVDEMFFLVVLRRQDRLAVSRFSSAVRAGHTGCDDIFDDLSGHIFRQLPPGRQVDDRVHYYDYLALTQRLTPFVPRERILVHRYEVDGARIDPVATICRHLDLDPSLLVAGEANMNAAMSLDAQIVIARLNGLIPSQLADGRRNEPYVKIKREIEATLRGGHRQVERQHATAFAGRYRESNEEVRARYLSDAGALFSDDFGMYPEAVTEERPMRDLDEMVDRYLRQYQETQSTPASPIERLRGTGLRVRSRNWLRRYF